MSTKLYEKCPACEGTGEVPQFQWSGAPACPSCRGMKFVETGLTAGQFELYHRKAHEEYERGMIDGFVRADRWREAQIGSPNNYEATLAAELDRIRAECRQRREAAGLGGPTEAELIEVGAVTLTCLDTLAAKVQDDDLADYVAEVASRLGAVLRKLGWEPKKGEAK